jgi:hypothetical protein
MTALRCTGGFLATFSIVLLMGTNCARAQTETLSDLALPGGLAGARQALDEDAVPDRAAFLIDVIQRFYQPGDRVNPQLQKLLTHLETVSRDPVAAHAVSDVLPLPLTNQWWIDAVFHGGATPDTLAFSILKSRNAALLYWSLLALDSGTRQWVRDQPALLEDVLQGRAPMFAMIARGFRVNAGVVDVPGGPRAKTAWEAVVGARVSEPAQFVRKVIGSDEGRQAYLFASLSVLAEPQAAAVLRLDAGSPDAPVTALRRLSEIFARIAKHWQIPSWPFWRPPNDPLLLALELRPDAEGPVRVPGSERFWRDVFAVVPGKHGRHAASRTPNQAVDPVWLLEQVFGGPPVDCRVRTEQVLFASRHFRDLTHETAPEALVVLRGLRTYPALVRTIERMRIEQSTVYRSAIDRAAALDAIGDADSRARAIAQFQGTLALVARAVSRGSVPAAGAAQLVESLSGVRTTDAGAYEGRLVSWIDENLRPRGRSATTPPAASDGEAPSFTGIEEDLLKVMAGPDPERSHVIDWEGTRYRVDVAFGELARMQRARGDHPVALLSAAWTLSAAADRLRDAGDDPQALAHSAAVLRDTSALAESDGEDRWPRDVRPQFRSALGAIEKALRSKGRADRQLPADVALIADELLARGLTELAYAAVLGGPEAGPITALDAAARHDLDAQSGIQMRKSWRMPVRAIGAPWHLQGSLLGIDVSLADRLLRRLSQKPPAVRPSLRDQDRQAAIEVVAMIEPTLLTDAARDEIASTIRAGRTRVNGAATADDLDAIAAALPLSGVRRSLLHWVFTRERAGMQTFFGTAELFWIGRGAAAGSTFDAWGAPAASRFGCTCLQMPGPRERDVLVSLWSTVPIMAAIPDLNLRLAELLADMHMPAALVPGILASATRDLVDGVRSRYPDDVRAVADAVLALTRDRVEQYLATLTRNGPLVPVEDKDVKKEHRP